MLPCSANALTDGFNQAYQDHNPRLLLQLMAQHAPLICPVEPYSLDFTPQSHGFTLQAGPTALTITDTFSLRLYYRGQGLTTDKAHIPMQYPWFQPDPCDPDDLAGFATRHVARGFRGESPWPESQWPSVGGVVQGMQHWPHRQVAFGPYSLTLVDFGQAYTVLLSQAEPDQPNAYGVINRGAFCLTRDGSFILALQLENHSDWWWAPWWVLGFAVPPEGTWHNPSTLLAWADDSQPAQPTLMRTWNYVQIHDQMLVLINPQTKTLNEPFKRFYAEVNWTALAIKGNDFLIVTRSVLHHPEQFFPFLEHGRHFVEVEHTGPMVGRGETSTVAVRVEIVPLSVLTEGKIQVFSQQVGQFEADVRVALTHLLMRLP